jgi:hypothetical protein
LEKVDIKLSIKQFLEINRSGCFSSFDISRRAISFSAVISCSERPQPMLFKTLEKRLLTSRTYIRKIEKQEKGAKWKFNDSEISFLKSNNLFTINPAQQTELFETA